MVSNNLVFKVEFLCYVVSLFGTVEGTSLLSVKAFAFMSVFRAGRSVNDLKVPQQYNWVPVYKDSM